MVVAGGGGTGVRGRARRLRHVRRVLVLIDAVDAELVAVVGIVREPGIAGQFRFVREPGHPRQHQPVIRARRFLGQSLLEQWQPGRFQQLRRFAVELLVSRAGQ